MNRYRWIIGLLLITLLTACSKSEKSEPEAPQQPSFINVYVYLPERPIVTRAGEVDPISNLTDESKINDLQIWVFNHRDKSLVAYHSPSDTHNLGVENEEGMVTYQLKVTPEFEAEASKPNVDVYVLANVKSYGFDSTTGATTLDEALLNGYGVESLTKTVPADGLPMAAVRRDAAVTGTAPVYNIANLKLTRTMSKLRFIFSREISNTPVKITSIKLDAGMIPTQEYLFLGTDDKPYHIGTAYNNQAVEFLGADDAARTDICQNNNPLDYAYQDGMDPQEYEDKILDKGLSGENPELSLVGPFYLNESDQRLSGKIYYQVGNVTKDPIPFSMSATDLYEFSRNHTWTVYAYYGGSGLELITVVVKDWVESDKNHDLFNW